MEVVQLLAQLLTQAVSSQEVTAAVREGEDE